MSPLHRSQAALSLAALLLGCGPQEAEVGPDDIVSRWDPAPVVVVVVVDTLARHTLQGWQTEFATSPNLQGFFEESTVLADTLAVRGITSPAIGSILTGAYPRAHGVRKNTGWDPPRLPTLMQKFQDAGYQTMGFAANTCQFIDAGVDERYCTWSEEMPEIADHTERDRMLVEELVTRIDARDANEPLFVWLHLMNPHTPYTLTEPWYSAFHPQPYEGDLDPENSEDLNLAILGEIPFDDADMAHVRAVYMSQVRETDELLGELFAALQERGLWEDAVVMFGADHGESLGRRGDDYLYHGCSPFNDVLAVAFAIRAPERLPQGLWLEGWVSQVDVGPTLADVAGIGWSGAREGATLVDEILDGDLAQRDLFLERGLVTAGVVSGGFKYVRDEDEGNTSCPPYSRDHPYPGVLDGLYELQTDTWELSNVADAEGALRDEMREKLCTWVLEEPWLGSEEETNRLIDRCADLMQ